MLFSCDTSTMASIVKCVFDNVLNYLALIANISVGGVAIFFTIRYLVSRKLREVQSQCNEISRIIAVALKEDKYEEMLSAAEQINVTELDFLEKLYIKNKVNERISLDVEMMEINDLQKEFDVEYKKTLKDIGKHKEAISGFEDLEERYHWLSEQIKSSEESNEMIQKFREEKSSLESDIKRLKFYQKELESKEERFKNEVLSPFLRKINVQISKVRDRLFSLSRL